MTVRSHAGPLMLILMLAAQHREKRVYQVSMSYAITLE